MTTGQRKMLFKWWRPLWAGFLRARTGAGAYPADERSARHAFTSKVIGQEKSWGSGTWQQPEIDAMLAVMWSIVKSGDFNLQLRQVNQPITRMECSMFCQMQLDGIRAAAAAKGDAELAERLGTPLGRESYVNGVCRRIHKCDLVDLKKDKQWIAILGALHHTREHKEGVAHNHPRSTWQRRGGRTLRPRGTAAAGEPQAPRSGGPGRTGSVTPERPGEDPF